MVIAILGLILVCHGGGSASRTGTLMGAGNWQYVTEEIGPPVMQTYEKVFEDEVIWEGDRTEVDYFNFAGSVDVNVVNVSSENTAGDPIFGAPGHDRRH